MVCSLKGMAMKTRYLLVLGMGIVVCIGVALAGISCPKGYHQWEYGIFQCGQQWVWCAPGSLVRTSSQRDFALEMKMGTYSISPIQVLNHLGGQGWELVEPSESGSTETYWFKRQR
jgi:hypothetical protein